MKNVNELMRSNKGTNNTLKVISIFLSGLALIFWVVAVNNINVEDISFDGLYTALPYSYWIAVILLTISFYFLLAKEKEWFSGLVSHVLLLILFTRGTLPLVYQTPRYGWVYKIIGYVSYVQDYGNIDLNLGPYFSWPNFLVLSGYINEIAGIDSPMIYAGWAQFIFNILFLIALLFVYRGLSRNWRRIWIAIWIFYISSWIGHDSFVPQAMNYFYYLMFMGITIRWLVQEKDNMFRRGKLWKLIKKISKNENNTAEVKTTKFDETQRFLAQIVLISLYLVIVTGHQLTPFVIVFGVVLLTFFVGHKSNTNQILLIVLLGTWILFVAWGFVENNSQLLDRVFALFENIYDGLFIRYNFENPPEQHQITLISGYFLTGFILFMAFLGGLRRVFRGSQDLTPIILAIAPFGIIFLFSYGGEVISRIFLFSLPWAAYLFSEALYSDGATQYRWNIEALGHIMISIVMFIAFVLSYFGNEKINYIPQGEIDLVTSFYDNAALGSLLYTPANVYPSKFVPNYFEYDYAAILEFAEIRNEPFDENDLNIIMETMSDKKYPESYFLFSISHINYIDKYNVTPDGALMNLVGQLIQTGKFNILEFNSEGVLLQYIGDGN